MNAVSKVYAEALFSLAVQTNKVETLQKDIQLVSESFKEVEGIKGFLNSVKVSKEEKKRVLRECFKDGIDEYTINFLCVLIDKRRIGLYKSIFHEFYIMCNEHLGIKEGVIESVRPLDEAQIGKLEAALSKDGVKVVLKNKINETLISGFKIIFDDQVIDNTMKNKITKMNETLLRKDVSLWN